MATLKQRIITENVTLLECVHVLSGQLLNKYHTLYPVKSIGDIEAGGLGSHFYFQCFPSSCFAPVF